MCACVVTVTGFREGSVIIDFTMSVVVNTDVSSVFDVIVDAIENEEILSEYSISSDSLSVVNQGL